MKIWSFLLFVFFEIVVAARRGCTPGPIDRLFFLEVALKFTFLLLNNLNSKSNNIVEMLVNHLFCTDLDFPFVANTKPHFIHIMLVVTRCRCRLRWFSRDTCTFFCEARSAVCQWL